MDPIGTPPDGEGRGGYGSFHVPQVLVLHIQLIVQTPCEVLTGPKGAGGAVGAALSGLHSECSSVGTAWE